MKLFDENKSVAGFQLRNLLKGKTTMELYAVKEMAGVDTDTKIVVLAVICSTLCCGIYRKVLE